MQTELNKQMSTNANLLKELYKKQAKLENQMMEYQSANYNDKIKRTKLNIILIKKDTENKDQSIQKLKA